jgi:hypothetical protein
VLDSSCRFFDFFVRFTAKQGATSNVEMNNDKDVGDEDLRISSNYVRCMIGSIIATHAIST